MIIVYHIFRISLHYDPVFWKAALTKCVANASCSTPVAKWKSMATRKSFPITLNQPDVRHGTNSNQNTIHRNTKHMYLPSMSQTT